MAERRAQERRHRQKIRDLENRLAKLQAERGPAEEAATAPAPPSDLPVEVVEPPPSIPGETDVIVAGYDEDGVEILYVGEAARATSVRPEVDLSASAPAPALVTAPVRSAGPAASSDALEVTGAAPPSLPRSNEPPTGATSKSAIDPRHAYRSAYEALKNREHGRAAAEFREFLRRHPDHDLADNAQYWLAEVFYDQRDFRAALAEFRKVIQNYPSGNKVAGAKLKAAYCHLGLGDTERGKTLLEKLMAEHPDSGPARLAADKLTTL